MDNFIILKNILSKNKGLDIIIYTFFAIWILESTLAFFKSVNYTLYYTSQWTIVLCRGAQVLTICYCSFIIYTGEFRGKIAQLCVSLVRVFEIDSDHKSVVDKARYTRKTLKDITEKLMSYILDCRHKKFERF